MTDFIQQSKALHYKHEVKEFWPGACMIDHNDDTRRHHAMLDECFNIIANSKINNCLSIGDSRARDAAYAKSRFSCHAIASDLNASTIGAAVQDGFIDDSKDIDVEQIPFSDDSFDLVIAKESFHHWPRPMIGLYEMIRVSRKFIALIEPNDCIDGGPSPYIDTHRNQYHDSYEEVGNYKYQISLRETLKVAWATGIPAVAAKGFNDPYQPDQRYEDWLFRKRELDSLGEAGERQFNLMAIVIIKSSDAINEVNKSNCRLYQKPFNPYA